MAYSTIPIEGGFLPADLLDRIATGDVAGQRALDFNLREGSRPSDAIQSAFSLARSQLEEFTGRLTRSRESVTTLTRRHWMTPFLECLDFDLEPQRAALVAGGDSFAISHQIGSGAEASPVHIAGYGEDLDRRAGARRSPQALVQEYLNRSDALWGLVTNGQVLRLLRASARIAQPAYLEFDLEAMLRDNQYSEFVLLYRLLHATRFPRTGQAAHDCWLERYYQQGIAEGGRVRDHLRDGVEAALAELGNGLLTHPESQELRDAIAAGRLSAGEYYRELLRLIYRLLFLMVVEERKLVFPAGTESGSRRDVYSDHYSLTRLRQRAERRVADDRYADLWQGLLQTFRLFRDDVQAQQLGLTALDGELFGGQACQHLEAAACANAALLRAIFRLSTFADGGVRRRVNYAGLDVEELGSVYESLLEYQPRLDLTRPTPFSLEAGSERKQTGSYYTPPQLVQELIEQTLAPVLTERLAAAKGREAQEAALLALRVCDPASGSGHFLLAAARRIARTLAEVRTGEAEPSPEEYRRALRDVTRQCLYAVDKNPLAVDLCKVALWLEGHNAGFALSFLDGHVKCGDSLVGVFDLNVLTTGIPDGAYAAVAGDERSVATALRKRNARERETGQASLDAYFGAALDPEIATQLASLLAREQRSATEVRETQVRYEALRGPGTDWWTQKEACDLWTAAFFLPLQQADGTGNFLVPTTATVRRYLEQPGAAYGPLVALAVTASQEQCFFHWPLEFPDVFDRGGFDCLLGNPPFLGGLKISEHFGDRYRKYLGATYPPAGIADLCAFFYRRAYAALRPAGNLGLVATNSIGQGDTREAGLAVLLKEAGTVTFARRFIKWPGIASVEVNLVALHMGAWDGQPSLDGAPVPTISSRLDDEPDQEPVRLKENAGKAFIGSYVRGIGFVLEPWEAQALIARDPRNAECLFPYLVGEDVNSRPDQSPSRWVINFQNWPLERAERYPDLLQILRERVKPEREKAKQGADRDTWWRFARLRGEMKEAIADLSSVIVACLVTEHWVPAVVPNAYVFAHRLVVFSISDWYSFAVLQSNLHELWARKHSSTLESRLNYPPSDCFDNFPFPVVPSDAAMAEAARIGAAYHEHRRQMMLERQFGLTKTYNLFHQQQCDDADVVTLRHLHVEVDNAILACYEWGHVDLEHGFHQNERGQTRCGISPGARREVLRALLALNGEIAERERHDGM